MKDTTLVVMAAGMGSRYGGIKQLDSFGPGGEIIMDYSIYDALKAGFNKIVIVIRKDIEEDFKEVIGNRLEAKAGVPVHYVFQDPDALPEGFTRPADRTKPWGTGQAVLAAKEFVKEPFLVINSDDFYGREPYKLCHDFLAAETPADGVEHFCMAGYFLGNTLSDNGAVTRGVCKRDENGFLTDIRETYSIAEKDGVITGKDGDGVECALTKDDVASMNMFGFTPAIFDELENRFVSFLSGPAKENPLKAEYLLPDIAGDLLKEGKADMKVLPTGERWFGVTYQEDKPSVKAALEALVASGAYPENLWG